jgi:hypothetical protein
MYICMNKHKDFFSESFVIIIVISKYLVYHYRVVNRNCFGTKNIYTHIFYVLQLGPRLQ